MCKAFVYCRQSSGDDDFSESIEVQKSNCLKLAEKNEIDVVGVFTDLNSSGKLYPTGFEDLSSKDLIYQNWLASISSYKKSRKGLGDLFKALAKNDVSYIIVDDYTRLARPLTGSFLDSFITQTLFSYKLKIMTVKSGELDLNSFNDSLIMALQNRINDNQIAIQRKKCIDSLTKLRNDGTFSSGVANLTGYKKGSKKYEIVVDEEGKNIVQFIFKSAIERKSYYEIVRELRTKFTYCEKAICLKTLKRMLKNPCYCGYIYDKKGELIESKQLKDIALVSFEDWSKVQEIFANRTKYKQRTKFNWNPLSGYLICGVCGKRITFHSHRRQNTANIYTCWDYLSVPNKPNCRINMASLADKKEGLGIINALCPLFAITALNKLKNGKEATDLKKEIEKINIKLFNLKEKEDKITGQFIESKLSDETYSKYLSAIDSERKELNNQLISMKNKSSLADDEETATKTLRNVVANKVSHADFEDLLKATLKEAVVWPDKVLFKTYYGDVELPRKKISHCNLLPHFSFAQADGKFTLYFYHKDRFIANPYSETITTIFKTENLTIYYDSAD